MPWSARRYMEGDWAGAMAEIAGHIKTLRGRGATRIVIAAHSMGCPAALGYAARHGEDVDALVLMAPGHTPAGYYMNPRSPVHESVDAARSEEHTSELQSLMRLSYAVFCLTKKTQATIRHLKRTNNPNNQQKTMTN